MKMGLVPNLLVLSLVSLGSPITTCSDCRFFIHSFCYMRIVFIDFIAVVCGGKALQSMPSSNDCPDAA